MSLESSWNVYTTEKYLQQSSDFRQSLKIIKDGAREKNLDRAALGYLNMTVQCLECHRYLKTAKPPATILSSREMTESSHTLAIFVRM